MVVLAECGFTRNYVLFIGTERGVRLRIQGSQATALVHGFFECATVPYFR